MIRDAPGALESDLQHYYRVDLADLWRGGLSLRRLSVLVKHLPSDSATSEHYSGAASRWSVTDYLIADVYHALAGREHPSRPQPQKASRHADLAARLQAQRARLAAQQTTA